MGRRIDTSQKYILKWPVNMKKCLTSLVIRAMQIKTSMRHHYIHIRMATMKKG